MKKVHLLIFCSFLALSSCVPFVQTIEILPDQTASITPPAFPSMEEPFDASEPVESIYLDHWDSLENNLRVRGKDCYEVSYTVDSMIFRIQDDLSYDTSYYPYIPNILKVKFPKKVVKVEGQGRVELHRNGKELVIRKLGSNYLIPDKKVDIVVQFGRENASSKIKHPFSLKRWGANLEYFPSFGWGQVEGEASQYLKGKLFVSWGITAVMNKFRVALRFAELEGDLIQPFNGLDEYDMFSNVKSEIGFGYELLNRTYFNFTPFVYGGKNEFEFFEENEAIEKKSIGGSFNYALGASIELKLDQLLVSKEKRAISEGPNFCLKVEGGWYPDYFQESLPINGSANYLTLGLCMYVVSDNNFRKIILKND